MFFFGDKAR